jgi:hypothetical protein
VDDDQFRGVRARPLTPERRGERRRAGVLVLAASAAVLMGGCAGLQQPEVERVAATFSQSGAADRCSLLATATVTALEHDESAPCPDALGQLELPGGQVVSSAVWGDNAQVRLTADTLFLTRTDAGWKVAAAGCRPQGDAPYLCRLEA